MDFVRGIQIIQVLLILVVKWLLNIVYFATSSVYKGVRLIDESALLNLFPDLPSGEGAIFQLSEAQLTKLNQSLGI